MKPLLEFITPDSGHARDVAFRVIDRELRAAPHEVLILCRAVLATTDPEGQRPMAKEETPDPRKQPPPPRPKNAPPLKREYQKAVDEFLVNWPTEDDNKEN